MSKPAPGADFLRALAAAALADGDPGELGRRAAEALQAVLTRQKSLVLDVQFTGFFFKGKSLGGADPTLLRAAGQLIVKRVQRVGFTADAGAADLTALFAILALPPAELAARDVVERLQRAAPGGIYLTSAGGDTYRPARKAPEEGPAPASAEASGSEAAQAEVPRADAVAPAEAPAPALAEAAPAPAAQPAEPIAPPAPPPQAEAPAAADTALPVTPEAERTAPEAEPSGAPLASAEEPQPAAPAAAAPAAPAETSEQQGGGDAAPPAPGPGWDEFGLGDDTDLSDFELLDEFPVLGTPAPSASRAASPESQRTGEVPANDMFHFFRTAHGEAAEEQVEHLPALLHAADNPTRFDELAEAAARAAQRLARSDEHAQAVELLDALVREAERPDRSRIFRDSAVQALRRLGAGETLQHLADLLHHGGQERERILRFFEFIGGEAVPVLEATLFRTPDTDLRAAVFRHVVRMDGASQRVMARAMADSSPARTRAILELVALPGIDAELALRWIAEAAGHSDASVRIEAAKHAGVVGGRGGLRVLLDLLNNDRDSLVRRAAIQALGALGDLAAAPFLVCVVAEAGDEEVQLSAIGALGRLASPEALPALMGIVNKRSLFGGNKLTRPKSAAIAAIARIPTPAAREVIQSLAGGKDSAVAAEAQRVLATLP